MRPASWIPLLIGVALTLAGCGAGSATKSTAPPTTSTAKSPPSSTVDGSGPLHFASPHVLAQGTGLAEVSCGGPTSCIALDDIGRAYHFDGTSWTGPVPTAGQPIGSGAVSVSCANPTICMAVATAGNQVVSWNGQDWSTPTTLRGGVGLEAVGCAPSGYCATVDAEGNAFAFNGQSWQGTSGDWGSVSSIACVSSTFCISVSGGISQWNGQQRTQPTPYGAASSFAGVSCPTAAFCTTVDQSGEALQWNGQSWSAPSRMEPGEASGATVGISPTGVSCPTTSFCTAVDDSGGVDQWYNGSWTRTDIDAGRRLTSVSCPIASFCVAVDQVGNVTVGKP